MIGHPSIALNRQEKIVHIVFAEMSGCDGHHLPSAVGTSNHQLFWARRGYDACP